MTTEKSQKQLEQMMSYENEVKNELPDGISVEGVYVGEECMKKLEDEQKDKIQLPPLPDGIFDWNEEELKTLVVPDDIIKVGKSLNFKMLQLWNLWGNLRTNERLIEIINSNITEESKQTDEFYLKQLLVNLVDRQGKILNGKTDLTKELFEETKKEKL